VKLASLHLTEEDGRVPLTSLQLLGQKKQEVEGGTFTTARERMDAAGTDLLCENSKFIFHGGEVEEEWRYLKRGASSGEEGPQTGENLQEKKMRQGCYQEREQTTT